MTGTAVGLQAGDASGTGLFDTANRTYDSKRLGSIDSGLEDKFPQLIGPNEVCLLSRTTVACTGRGHWMGHVMSPGHLQQLNFGSLQAAHASAYALFGLLV